MIGLVGANGVVRHEGMARRSILLGKADPAAAVSCTRMCGPSRRDMASTLRVTFICGNGFCMLFAVGTRFIHRTPTHRSRIHNTPKRIHSTPKRKSYSYSLFSQLLPHCFLVGVKYRDRRRSNEGFSGPPEPRYPTGTAVLEYTCSLTMMFTHGFICPLGKTHNGRILCRNSTARNRESLDLLLPYSTVHVGILARGRPLPSHRGRARGVSAGRDREITD